MATKKTPHEPKIDWNIWHDAFMEAYDQIDFETCAKAIMFYKSVKFKEDCDPKDEERVLDMADDLRDTVKSCTNSTLLEWSKDSKHDKNANPWSVEVGFVKVSAWGPEADEEEHKATIEIQIFLENTIH